MKAKLVCAAARRMRLLLGARESPKFFAVRTIGSARQALLEAGQEFAAAGTIARADDLVYLTMDELKAMSLDEERDWQTLIADRRQAFQRELCRKQAPRVLDLE